MSVMRIIAHLDMDAFFAAIEERENPQFVGLGIVVGADPIGGMGRGVVATANYQARKYGIGSAMPISHAFRLAKDAEKRGEPKTVFLPVNGHYYGEVSDRIFRIIHKYTSVVEQTSIDEAYLDLSQRHLQPQELIMAYRRAEDLIKKIKQQIRDSEKLTAKVAISPNKLVSKIASSLAKPDSLRIILPQDVSAFLEELSVRVIPGIGPKTEELLHSKNIFKISDLWKVTKEELREWLGKWGEEIYYKARGIDESPLEIERKPKSISEQETFNQDMRSPSYLLESINRLSEKVFERMLKEGVKGYKTVTITVRFFDFVTRTRSKTLKDHKTDLSSLKREVLKLFMPFLDARENKDRKMIRLLGVGIENFQNSNATQAERSNESINENKQGKLF